VQRAAIDRSARIVILTDRARAALFQPQLRERVHVIPCCADLAGIERGSANAASVRRRLGLEDRAVMVYVGKFPSWSMPGEMADLFELARDVRPDLHFLIITQEAPDAIRENLLRAGADPGSFTITSAPHDQVAGYLAASQFAITFIRPARSTIGQSPTKLGEYLGAGLPVLYSAGIGDLDDLMSGEVGVRVDEHSCEAHSGAARAIFELVADPGTAERCRELAHRWLSLQDVGIPAYLALYEELAADLDLGGRLSEPAKARQPDVATRAHR
jgi:glycosyltransferase involved in cell wall biosynthesis